MATDKLPYIDLAGQKFGLLTAVEIAGRKPVGPGKKKTTLLWKCRCDCGREIICPGTQLRCGDRRNCGRKYHWGQHRERRINGERSSAEYQAWTNMKSRCLPTARDYERSRYFDRGIAVCEQWLRSFESFLAEVGRRPSPEMTLDRIDNNRGYEPGNVRWATKLVQQRNREDNFRVTVNGESKTAVEWAEITGVREGVIRSRIKKGIDARVAVSTPPLPRKLRKKGLLCGRS